MISRLFSQVLLVVLLVACLCTCSANNEEFLPAPTATSLPALRELVFERHCIGNVAISNISEYPGIDYNYTASDGNGQVITVMVPFNYIVCRDASVEEIAEVLFERYKQVTIEPKKPNFKKGEFFCLTQVRVREEAAPLDCGDEYYKCIQEWDYRSQPKGWWERQKFPIVVDF